VTTIKEKGEKKLAVDSFSAHSIILPQSHILPKKKRELPVLTIETNGKVEGESKNIEGAEDECICRIAKICTR
jgi:hypothetical protein